MTKKKNSGFTLIELLVAATIIGILTAIAFVNYASAQRRARDAKRKADMESIRGALEMRKADLSDYPTSAEFPGFGSSFTESTYTYMQVIPQDPKYDTYQYYYFGDGSTYQLCAYLESGGTDSCSGGDCGSDVSCNYQVIQP